jgi:type II secretory pathway predicted ATPase ExeA
MTVTSPTAGQRQALSDLGDAVEGRRPLVLLFGETGAGKSSVVDAFLAAAGDEVVVAGVSATGSAFVSSPSFDALLSAICAGLKLPAASEQGPAALAGLGALIRATAEACKAVVVAIDHADRLGDGVIADLVRLHEALGVPAAALVRIFAGTAALAPRIETVLRQMGSDERLTEIRLSAPTADEVATILAYADAARPGGPVLTPDAIAAVSAYARGDLHLAEPMADAVRSLAEDQGKGEITAGLVHETLQGLWAPEAAGDGEAAFAGLHDVAAGRGAMLAPAPLGGLGPTWVPQWAGNAWFRAQRGSPKKRLLALSLAGSSALLAALVAFALVAGRDNGSQRHAAEEARRSTPDLAAPAAPAAPSVTTADPAPASTSGDAEGEAGPQPAEPQGLGAPDHAASAPEPGEPAGAVAAKPKTTRAPKPVTKPRDPAQRWVQTR